MTEALIDHLWQSTWFALAAALLVRVLHNNSASVRFRVWLAASLKFLIPLPLLVLAGKQVPWHTATSAHAPSGLSVLMNQLTEPAGALMAGFATPLPSGRAPPATSHAHLSVWAAILLAWSVGFAALFCRRLYQWLKLNSIAWSAVPLTAAAPIPVRETPSTLEPGIFGIFWPVLLLPKGIAARLAPEQLDTIIAHELHHWRRKDNLAAAFHMIVEALFWFHPLAPSEFAASIQDILAKAGFADFVVGETTLGSQKVATLNFDKTSPAGKTWYVRYYFIIINNNTLVYTLGFGTTNREAMFPLYEKMAGTFVSKE